MGFVSPQPHISGIQDAADALLAVQGLYPLEERERRILAVHRWPAGDNLEQDDAEAVDVRLCASAVRVDELRIDVPHGALDEVRRLRAGAMVAEAGQTEVSQLCVVGRVKQDVAWLYVTMHNTLIPVPMEVV